MLHVVINQCPFGDQNASKKIGEIFITNDLTGDDSKANYDVVLKEEDGSLAEGYVPNHDKANGAFLLTFRAILSSLVLKSGERLDGVYTIQYRDHT